jgi:hypothetical protein
MKKIYMIDENTGGRFLLTVSSAATPENAHETLTAETGGSCIGPGDDAERELAEVLARWGELEEMGRGEIDERISHLAEEWGLAPGELEYLF